MPPSVLTIARQTFAAYRHLGERAMAQIPDDALFLETAPGANSIAVIVHHLAGNMLSRWTDFLTTDGEKPWRQRDTEFEQHLHSRSAVDARWHEGWSCLEATLLALSDTDLDRIVKIRGEDHTVQEALVRQIAHYAYHVGQIVLIAKSTVGDQWVSLSIPKGGSDEFNRKMRAKK